MTQSVELVLGPRRLGASSRSASSRDRGSTSGTRGWSREPGDFFTARAGGSRSSSRTRGRRDARVRERLPAPRLDRRRGRGQPKDAAVPVPRVDVRARRPAARGAARGLRRRRGGARAGAARTLGAVPVRERRRRCGAARGHARRRSGPGRELGLDLDALRFHHRAEWRSRRTGRSSRENFLECYHCAVAHPSFTALVDVSPDAYRLEVGPAALDADRPGARRRDAQPVPLRLAEHRRSTSSPASRTSRSARSCPRRRSGRTASSTTSSATTSTSPWIADLLELDDQVGREDTALVERVQTGVASGALADGRLLGEAEQLVAHFQGLVRDALA